MRTLEVSTLHPQTFPSPSSASTPSPLSHIGPFDRRKSRFPMGGNANAAMPSVILPLLSITSYNFSAPLSPPRLLNPASLCCHSGLINKNDSPLLSFHKSDKVFSSNSGLERGLRVCMWGIRGLTHTDTLVHASAPHRPLVEANYTDRE